MSDLDIHSAARFYAEYTKVLFREVLGYQLFFRRLKDAGTPGIDELLQSAKDAPEVSAASESHAAGVEKSLPPNAAECLDQALQKALAILPINGMPN